MKDRRPPSAIHSKDREKEKAKALKKAKAKPPSVVATSSITCEDDIPQSKAEEQFLQQVTVKLNAAKEMYDHIGGLQKLSHYDDARVTTCIKALDARLPKIVKCKLVKTQAAVGEVLCVLRGFQDLNKAFETV